MPDILISYAREDAVAAARLRDALAGQGWDVRDDAGNDDRATEGHHHGGAIGDALNSVKCVVVLWSSAAIGSKAVRLGARVARLAGKLVPVRIDGTDIPSDLRDGRPANLSGWSGDVIHPEFRKLTQTLEERAQGRRRPGTAGPRSSARWPARALASVALLAAG